jgi:Tfp pilus assembly protein PilO
MASKKFSDLTPVQQAAIVGLLPAVTAAVVFYYFVMPVRQNAATLRAQLQMLQAQNLRGRFLEAHHADLLKHIAEAQSELQQLRQVIPDEAADDAFVRTVYANAASAAVHVRSLAAGKSEQKEYFTAMPFQLHADGTYYRLLDFFVRLARSPRIVDVSGLLLGAPQGGGGRGAYKISAEETVAADCVLTTYFKNPERRPGSSAGILPAPDK